MSDMSTCVLNLPDGLLVDLYVEWLDMVDLCKLDSSIMNSHLRPRFLESIGGDNVIFEGLQFGLSYRADVDYLTWTKIRKISIKKIQLARNINLCDAMCLITDKVFRNVKKMNLESCVINDCFLVHLILKCCGSLTDLCIDGCELVTDDALVAIGENCESLSVLDISSSTASITHMGLESILKNCRSLKSLQMYNCSESVDDRVVASIADNCPNINHIDLTCCWSVNDASLTKIAEKCTSLKELNLTGCVNITNESILALSQGCPTLTKLYTHDCQNLTDLAFTRLAERCQYLVNIDLFSCVLITDQTLISFATYCPLLKQVSVQACHLITDASITELARNCPALEDLNLSGCGEGITDASVVAVGNHCASLREIYLYETGVTQFVLGYLVSKCSHLRIISIDELLFTDRVRDTFNELFPHITIHD